MANAGKGFDLAAVLSSAVSDLGTAPADGREQIEYIDISLLDSDEKNFYTLSNVNDLATNIAFAGLQQPIRVRPAEDGRYIIVSGHRRRAALQKLVEEGMDQWKQVPCIVERDTGSDAIRELRLIYANSDTRTMNSADISKQAERVEALLYQLKKEGYEFPGRMRDHVAQACKVSKTKLANLKVIRDNLSKSWRPYYEKGSLKESVALALARLPADHQEVIFSGIKAKKTNVSYFWEYEATRLGEQVAAVEEIKCKRDGKNPCSNTHAMQQKIVERNTYTSPCQKCCDKCSDLATCKYACPMLAEKVKKLRSDAKEQRKQEKLAKEEEERPIISEIMALWNRFGQARNTADKSVKACYEALGRYYTSSDEQKTVELECLEAKFTVSTSLPYSYSCSLEDVQKYVRLADLLGVSIDYLFCRTDVPEMATKTTPQPEGQLVFSGWMPGGTTPATPCDVVADFDMGGTKELRRCCRWDGSQFLFDKGGISIELPPIRWMMLPPVEAPADD